MHRDDIHVALTEDKITAFCLLRDVESVQISRLVKDRRLRRVQIFRLSVSHDSAAEADHTVRHIHDRENHTVPELIMKSPLLVIGGNAGEQNVLIGKALRPQMRNHIRTGAVRKAKPEGAHRLRRQLPLLEIRKSLFPLRRPEKLEIIRGSLLVDRKKLCSLIISLPCLLRIICFGKLDARPVCQNLQSLLKAVILIFHEKGQDIPALAAAKAVKNLFARVHRKRRRLLIMKRTQPHKAGTAFFQMHMGADHIDDIIRRNHLLHNFFRIIHSLLLSYCQHFGT